MNAIVLDGEQRAALAVTRSLGRHGVKVAVGSESTTSLASRSRYCAESFVYPPLKADPRGFLQATIEFGEKFGDSVLFPITDIAVSETLSNRNLLPDRISLPFVEYEKYARVSDKIALFRTAKSLDIPVPDTLLSTEFDNTDHLVEGASRIGFPVVVKPCNSRLRTDSGWIEGKVSYAQGPDALREITSREVFRRYPFLVQKRIVGPGIGIFLLMREGEVVARFAHRRIREKPPSGGVSVLSEGIIPPPDASDAATRILESVGWTGVAMVEFKIDRDEGKAKLLEVNARFWGSLQLAVYSGVDFPTLLFRMAAGERVPVQDAYKTGLKSRWEMGDFDHLLLRFLKDPSSANLPAGLPSRTVLFKEFLLDFFRPSVRNEILQWGDFRPFVHEVRRYFQDCFH